MKVLGGRVLQVLGVAVVFGVLSGCAPSGPPRRELAGQVPWNSAVLASDGRTLHLLADWDHLDGFACDTPDERVRVQQSTSRVTVTIDGYARPLPAGSACGGVGYPLQAKTIRLASILGHRSLVDGGSGARRRVILDTAVPTVHRVPARFVAVPMTWSVEDSHEPTATRLWQIPTRSLARAMSVLRLTAGLSSTYFTFNGPVGLAAGTAAVGTARAELFESKQADQIVRTVRWTRADGQQISLQSQTEGLKEPSMGQLVNIARSVA